MRTPAGHSRALGEDSNGSVPSEQQAELQRLQRARDEVGLCFLCCQAVLIAHISTAARAQIVAVEDHMAETVGHSAQVPGANMLSCHALPQFDHTARAHNCSASQA